MLFTQHNGLAHALGDQSEVDVLQNLACAIGPRVDGIAASLSMPQSMGAFSTAGAQGACAGRSQQQEQHTPTTTRGLGETPAALDPTRSAIIRAVMSPDMQFYVNAAGSAPAPAAPDAAPMPMPASMPMAMTYPPGTITTFNPSTSMWRVAVPSMTPGLGIFGAAAAFTEVTPVAAAPAGATPVTASEFDKQTGQTPIYKKWQFWAIVTGAVAVVGGGSVLLFRR